MIDERTLRELYLLPFELAVRDGGSLGIMTSYNRVNGVYGPDNAGLLEGILRGEWGFDGFVVTDWYGLGDTAAAARAGLDLEMPGPRRFYGPKLAAAVRSGEVDESLVDAAVMRLLGVFDRIGALDDPPDGVPASIDKPEHRAVARQAGAASIVLLTNEGVLPLGLTRRHVGGDRPQRGQHLDHGWRLRAARRALPGVGPRRPARAPSTAASRSCTSPASTSSAASRPSPPRSCGRPTATTGGSWSCSRARSSPVTSSIGRAAPTPSCGSSGRPPSCGRVFSARLTGAFTPEEDGRWVVSLAQAGRARLFVDGRVVIDGFDRPLPPGTRSSAPAAMRSSASLDVEAGRPLEIVVEFANPDGRLLSGVRVGARPAPPADLVERAVAAAVDG